MKIIGHRGARGLAPENTIAALRKGLEHNVDELEFDLRVTKDKVVVLHHDPFLLDPNGMKLSIKENTYEELKSHKNDLITLEQALELTLNTVPINLEVKPGEPTQVIVQKVKKALAHGWENKNIRFVSFSFKVLEELHKEFPDIQIVVNHTWSGFIATRRARKLNTKRISMNYIWLWSGFISSISKSGYQLSTYALNNPKKAKRWSKQGLYAVITDRPDLCEK